MHTYLTHIHSRCHQEFPSPGFRHCECGLDLGHSSLSNSICLKCDATCKFGLRSFFQFWLVVWNMFYDFPYIGNNFIPTDEVIFFRGVGIPPTSSCYVLKLEIPKQPQTVSAAPGSRNLGLLRWAVTALALWEMEGLDLVAHRVLASL